MSNYQVCIACLLTTTLHAETILVPQSEAVPAAIGLQLNELGKRTGDYLNNAERLHIRLIQLRAQLDDCHSCENESSLRSEYNQLDQRQRQRLQGESLALHAIGLPYDSFGEAATAMFGPNYRSPDPALAKRFADAKRNAELNYCFVSNGGDMEKTFTCRAVYNRPDAEGAALSVPLQCFRLIGRKLNVNLDQIPPPTAVSAEFAEYKSAWEQYDVCRRNGDIYQWIQHETARLCRTEKIDPTAELAAFSCACQEISKPSGLSCAAVSQSKPVIALPRLVTEHPVSHVLLVDPGPDLFGVRLLMPMADAEKLVTAHMPIGQIAVIGKAEHGQTMVPQQIEYQTSGFTGKLLISQDGNEFFFLLEAARFAPGRVFEASRARLLSVEDQQKILDERRRTSGDPTPVPGLVNMFWGQNASLLCAGRSPENTGFWVDQASGWPLGGNDNDSHNRYDERRSTVMHSVRMPRLGPKMTLNGTYDCGPLLEVSTGGDPRDFNHTGRPMWVIESLFDIGLTQWFWRKGEDSDVP